MKCINIEEKVRAIKKGLLICVLPGLGVNGLQLELHSFGDGTPKGGGGL